MAKKKKMAWWKKKLLKYGIIGLIIFVWFPTFTPEDAATTFVIIAVLGLGVYLFISVLIMALLIFWILWRNNT